MRLIHVESYQLKEFRNEKLPQYAVLSHTWRNDGEELSFQELTTALNEWTEQFKLPESKTAKLRGCFQQALQDGLRYVWIDTCCIDRTNAVELTEAINSMFDWYRQASMCYVYLSDVPSGDKLSHSRSKFRLSRWFERGWTLPELLAPDYVRFYNAQWELLGTKGTLSATVGSITGIPRPFLLGVAGLSDASVAQRMSWVAKRHTTKPEDLVYCLLGIFGVAMPLLYGEGLLRAFVRLQEQIIRTTTDDSILAWGLALEEWNATGGDSRAPGRVLASSPLDFEHCGSIVCRDSMSARMAPLEITPGHVRVNMAMHTVGAEDFGLLNCGPREDSSQAVGIPLVHIDCPSGATVSRNHFRPEGGRCRLLSTPGLGLSRDLVYIHRYPQDSARCSSRYEKWVHVDRFNELDVKLIEAEPKGCWHEDRALIALHAASGDELILLRFRCKDSLSLDFVVTVAGEPQNPEQSPRCHILLYSREASLAKLASHLRISPGLLRAAGANSTSLSLVAVLESMAVTTERRMFMLTLANDEWPLEDTVVVPETLEEQEVPDTEDKQRDIKGKERQQDPIEETKKGEEQRETYEDICRSRSDPFVYRNLDRSRKEIRLVRILNRGIFEDAIFSEEGLRKSEADPEFRLLNERTFVVKAAIEHFPLDSCPPFIALSYTWGDTQNPRPIFFPTSPDDHECETYQQLDVTENLFQALRQTRSLQGTEYFWADAICINQSNTAEKNWQVAQMWDIYKAAKRVFVWLGSGGAHTNTLMEQLQAYAVGEVERLGEGGSLDDLRVPETCSEEMLSEFMAMTEKPYWTRAWVRQEMSAKDANEILFWYGRRVIQFRILDYFARGLKNSASIAGAVPPAFRSPFHEVARAIVSSSEFLSVRDSLDSVVSGKAKLVHIFDTWLRKVYLWGSGLQATDPRDLVFSLVSMTTWREQDGPKLQADYDKSTRQVYIETAQSWWNLSIWRNDPEDTCPSGDDLSLPSWVPDWRRPIRPVHFLQLPPWGGNSEHQYQAGNMFKYSGGYTIKPERCSTSTANPCFVYMEGFLVDRIQFVSGKLVRNSSQDARETVSRWIQQLNNLVPDDLARRLSRLMAAPPLDKYGGPSFDNRWRVPVLNLGIVDSSIAEAPQSYQRVFDMLSRSANQSTLGTTMTQHVDATAAGRYIDIALVACEGKSFFTSKAGMPGLAFSSIKPGDCIVVFPGLDVPLILREVPGTGYRIISDAYVQGIMNAETKDDVGPDGFRLEEFAIF